jgi:hypothetical protein
MCGVLLWFPVPAQVLKLARSGEFLWQRTLAPYV